MITLNISVNYDVHNLIRVRNLEGLRYGEVVAISKIEGDKVVIEDGNENLYEVTREWLQNNFVLGCESYAFGD